MKISAKELSQLLKLGKAPKTKPLTQNQFKTWEEDFKNLQKKYPPTVEPVGEEEEKRILQASKNGVIVGVEKEEKDCFVRQQADDMSLGVRVNIKYIEPVTTVNGETINDKSIIEANDYLFYANCKKGLSTNDFKKTIALQLCNQFKRFREKIEIKSFIIVAIFETINIKISDNPELCKEFIF